MHRFRFVFIASFLFSAHLALLTYINSSMLGRFGNATVVSGIFTISSVLSFLFLLLAPRIVRRVGLIRATVSTLVLSSFFLYVLTTTITARTTVLLFVMYFSLNTITVYFFDLFVEHYSKIKTTGATRGLFLTINNLGWVGAPVIAGVLLEHFGFSTVYFIGAILIFCTMILIATTQRTLPDEQYERSDLRASFHAILLRPTIRRIITINFLLQFFFAVMVIYSPGYLRGIGFHWDAIGGMFSLMLMAFVIFQFPIGRLADRIGETKLIRLGLLIAATGTLYFATASKTSFWIFAGLLFLTRIGASIIEVCCDSYFFKQVTETDAPLVSLYRAMVPLAYTIAPLTGALILLFASYRLLFILLAILLLIAALYSNRLAKKS